MSARHRPRRTRNRGVRVFAAGVVLPLLIIGGIWGGYRLTTTATCVGSIDVTIAASPDIAPAIRTATGRWVQRKERVQGRCVAVRVVAANPVDIAAAIARDHNLSVPGLASEEAADTPQVWIPDSTIWLQRLREASAAAVPAAAPSIANSPLALAVPDVTARSYGWVDKPPSWATLCRTLVDDVRLRPGIVEPNRDAAAVAAVIAMNASVASLGAQGAAVTGAAIKTFASGQAELPSALLARFPRDNQPRTIALGLGIAPLPEQAVYAYNATSPPVPLAAIYPQPRAAALDYPYAVLPGLADDKAAAAAKLRDVLAGALFRNDLAKVFLRGPDGVAAPAFQLGANAPSGTDVPAAPVDPATIGRALTRWREVTQ